MRTRASSPDTYTVSTPITRTTSATLNHATKRANNNNNLQTATKKHSRHDTCTTHHACNNRWTSSKLSRLAEPVTLSSVTKEQTQATTTKNTILLVECRTFLEMVFSVKSLNLSFRKWVGLRMPNKWSHPGDSWKNKFIFVPKIHQVLSILSCGALSAPPWEMSILRNTTCLCAKVP
jgi:hypothetical protein